MLIRHIEKNIKKDIFLCEVVLNVNNVKDLLIVDIEKGIVDQSNQNYKTNVLGNMTDWKYFSNNEIFQKKMLEGMNEIKKTLKLNTIIKLTDAWGIKINEGEQTKYHDHSDVSKYSGILYLNDNEQTLNFPELNISIKPKEGHFLFFSSILVHGTDINISNKPKYAIAFNTLSSFGY